MTLTTPSGTPASCAIFTSIMQAPGSCSLGLITYVLPHTRAIGNICERRREEGREERREEEEREEGEKEEGERKQERVGKGRGR